MLSSKPKHCTSTQLEVIDDLHREEIEILNDFMRVLPNSDDDQIDEWLQRLEWQVLHHFNEEEACMKRVMCPGFKRHVDAHSETLKAIREARKNWDEDRDLMQLWNFLEYDYMAWFEHHVRDYDLPAAEFIRQYEEDQ
ncbi:MAG: hemerythrin family protein [Deltaproteobacteria bacterium]